jgi:hypothetical protein
MYTAQDVYNAVAGMHGMAVANELSHEVLEATARYMNINDYGIDVEADRIAIATADVLRLAYEGEYQGLDRTCKKFHESDD